MSFFDVTSPSTKCKAEISCIAMQLQGTTALQLLIGKQVQLCLPRNTACTLLLCRYRGGSFAYVAARNMSGRRPEEYYISDKWDKCTDLAVRRIVYGTLGGGAAALILFRTCHASLIIIS